MLAYRSFSVIIMHDVTVLENLVSTTTYHYPLPTTLEKERKSYLKTKSEPYHNENRSRN